MRRVRLVGGYWGGGGVGWCCAQKLRVLIFKTLGLKRLKQATCKRRTHAGGISRQQCSALQHEREQLQAGKQDLRIGLSTSCHFKKVLPSTTWGLTLRAGKRRSTHAHTHTHTHTCVLIRVADGALVEFATGFHSEPLETLGGLERRRVIGTEWLERLRLMERRGGSPPATRDVSS